MTTPINPSLLLCSLPGIGASRYWNLIDHYDTPSAIIATPVNELPALNTRAKVLLGEYQRLSNQSELAQQVTQIQASVSQQGAHIISHTDSQYPTQLKEIYRPPPLLFVKGCCELLQQPQLAIVGTRNPTAVGQENAHAFAASLAQQGFIITSGLALGIDGIAHQAAITAQGKTIAVMATGIDLIYPKRHQQLAHEIIQSGGALVSEFTPGVVAKAGHFPQRNRIISGLSLGTFVIEAALKSGSLITARFALEQNREVFALPGSIHSPQSKGNHWLIKQGATFTETIDDITQQLDGLFGASTTCTSHHAQPHNPQPTLTPEEQQLLEQMGYEPTSIDQLVEYLQLPTAQIAATVLSLELKGIVQQSHWGIERVIYSTDH